MAIVQIWGDKHGPFMQALHCIYFAGFLFASLIAKPFLSDTEVDLVNPEQTSVIYTNNTNNNSDLDNHNNVTVQIKTTKLPDLNGNWTELNGNYSPEGSQVQIPYMIAGALCLLASIFYIIMFCIQRRSKKQPVRTEENSGTKLQRNTLEKAHKIVFVSLVFCLLFSYTSTEINYSVFLSVFLVQSHHYTPQDAAITLSVYFTAFVVGRAIGIYIIKKIKPKTLLAGGIALTVISNIMLYFSHSHAVLIWVTISVAALGMSTQYATIVSWTTEYINFSGWAGTAILLSGATGYLIGPFLFGALFNVFGISSFMYILSSAIVLQIVLFVVLYAFVRIL